MALVASGWVAEASVEGDKSGLLAFSLTASAGVAGNEVVAMLPYRVCVPSSGDSIALSQCGENTYTNLITFDY